MKVEQKYIDLFWEKVDKSGECWLWTAGKTTDGYGAWRYPVNGKQKFLRAHRFAWLLKNGALEVGKELNHLCRIKLCIRPEHLEEITHKEHMWRTEGSFADRWGNREACEQGHPYTEDNLVAWAIKRGWRKCKTCAKAKYDDWRKANPEKMKAAVQNYKTKNREHVLAKDREYHRNRYVEDEEYREKIRARSRQ